MPNLFIRTSTITKWNTSGRLDEMKIDDNLPAEKVKAYWLGWLIKVCVLLFACISLWRLFHHVPYTVAIPAPPPLPHPNAFDYDLQAGEELRSYGVGGIWGTISYYRISPGHYSPAIKDKVLADNLWALDKLHEGFYYAYQSPPIRSFKHPIDQYYRDAGELAALLALSADRCAARSDWPGAVNANLDAIRLGTDMARHAPWTGVECGLRIQFTGRQDLWKALGHLDAAQARAAMARMHDLIRQQVSLADMLQEEKWAMQASLLELFQDADWRQELWTMTAGGPWPDTRNVAIRWMDPHQTWVFHEMRTPQQVMDAYTAVMDAMIAQARRPYADGTRISLAPCSVVERLSWMPAKSADYVTTNEAENTMLLTAFALQAFHTEHGGYPTSLAALVPGYLPAMPADPFAPAGATLKYKQQGTKYLLYSVGPNGKDDGGKKIDSNSDYWHGVQRYSGDVVAGM